MSDTWSKLSLEWKEHYGNEAVYLEALNYNDWCHAKFFTPGHVIGREYDDIYHLLNGAWITISTKTEIYSHKEPGKLIAIITTELIAECRSSGILNERIIKHIEDGTWLFYV